MTPAVATPFPHDEERRPTDYLPPLTLVGLVAAIVAIVLIAYLSFRTSRVREENVRVTTTTQETLLQLKGLTATMIDAETGERGFLLTGDEAYLEPFVASNARVQGEFTLLRSLLSDNATLLGELSTAEELAKRRMEELNEAIALRRAGNTESAVAVVRTNRGKSTMDALRTAVARMESDVRAEFNESQLEWQRAVTLSTWATWGGAGFLFFLITGAAVIMSRDYRRQRLQAWLRAGQAGLGEKLQGEQRLDVLGQNVLDFLGSYLDAQVGAVYIVEGQQRYRRFATYAVEAASGDVVRDRESLVGQAARENRTLHVSRVPDGYLDVASGLGRGRPADLLVAPGTVDGLVQAIVELGFFRRIGPPEEELVTRISESLGVAVRTSRDRTQLEELLGETQRQSEELQVQQEELRVSNEELEEQSRALKESQGRLETQQAELEQINANLEEQTQILEMQKEGLSNAQHTLAAKADELERANQYKSEFLANMSHELRTPLNSSLILAKLLADNKDGNLSDEQVRFAQTIESAGNDLLALINDILDLSKIEAGKVDLLFEPVTVSREIDGLVTTFQPVAQQKGLRFDAAVAPGTPERIETDRNRLSQILKNLLSNAFKFTEKGEVALSAHAGAGGTVTFEVRDTGIGIAGEQQDVIFEAFRQADGSTHRKYGGTGLGLSISRDLARLLGGDITVSSVLGSGSVFTLTLPVAKGEVARRTPAAQPVEANAPARAREPVAKAAPISHAAIADDRDRLTQDARTILIVEDDTRFAGILRDLAHEMGFLCVVTHSANDGVAAAKTYHPSAILLDVNLPDHSGLGVLDQLKRNPRTRHIPVHVISVADYAQQALERGAIGYALKPVQREELINVFRRLEAKATQGIRRVLVVEDDDRQRESIEQLLAADDVKISAVATASEALAQLSATTFDCMVMDLKLPDLSGYDLLQKMAEHDHVPFPPVIVYTGRSLSREEEQQLNRFSKAIIIKDARSPERLLDEVTLFLHQVEATLPAERQRMLKAVRDRDSALEGRRILVVEDDARNIFALTSVLEPKGARIEIARNGREALAVLARSTGHDDRRVDLVLMDIMMPEMDGLTAMREIRKQPEWKKLPIIALTAKAMKDDQEKCLSAGANDYIAKPLDVEKLLSLVRVWMPK